MEARLIYSDSETCADMYYATRFFAPDPFLYLRDEAGRTHLVTSVLEIDRARRTARVDQFHDWSTLRRHYDEAHPDSEGDRADDNQLIPFFLQGMNIHHLQVPDDFPFGLAERLRRAGITITPGKDPFWPQRERKSPEEVRAIETALEITGIGMAAGIELIRAAGIGADGWLYLGEERLTSERVRGEINATLVRQGAIPKHTIVAGGDQGADPHEEGSGPLPARRPIILDVFPRVERTGYYGDMTRTVCRGTPPERVQRAWDAVKKAQELAFSRIRAGESGLDIHEAVSHCLTEAGFPTGTDDSGRQQGFFHGTGHGLGLEIHEGPRISKRDKTLEPGHVITVEPGLYYPDMGGVRLEDVVVVLENGCRNLTHVPKFLQV